MHEEYDSREKTAYQQGDHLTRFDCEVSEKQHDVFVLLVLDMPLLCISVVFDGQSIIPWTISSIQPGQTSWGCTQVLVLLSASSSQCQSYSLQGYSRHL